MDCNGSGSQVIVQNADYPTKIARKCYMAFSSSIRCKEQHIKSCQRSTKIQYEIQNGCHCDSSVLTSFEGGHSKPLNMYILRRGIIYEMKLISI